MDRGPAFSVNESPIFYKMVERRLMYFVALHTFVTYIFIVMAEDYIIKNSQYLLNVSTILASRYYYLKIHDGFSHVSYIGTFLSAVVFFVVSITVLSLGYWRHVISKNKMIPQRPSLTATLIFTIMTGGSAAAVFFVPLHSGGYREGIFYWPYFPVLGVISALGVVFSIFSMYVCISK